MEHPTLKLLNEAGPQAGVIHEVRIVKPDAETEEGSPVYSAITTNKHHAVMMEMRTVGEVGGKSLWLNDVYDWQIVRDSLGELVLVATVKAVERG